MQKNKESSQNIPRVGDLIECDDSDVGIVVDTYEKYEELMVTIRWESGKVCTDPWDSVVFDGKKNRPLFRILSAI